MTEKTKARAARALLLATSFMCPTIAAAQDSERGDIVVVGKTAPLATPNESGSRLNLSLLETPASIAVVRADEARARGDFTVQDAVTRAPGITNVGNPGNGGTALAARGFGGQGSVLQLVDGVRLFPVAGTITFPVDLWTVERIDVLSGPASVLYGQGALGGAINVVTRKPNRERHEFEAEAGYGSFETWHAAAGAGGPIGPLFAYRVDASYRESNGYVDRGDSDSLALSGALAFTPAERFTLTLRHDYGDQHPMRYFGTPLVDGRLDTSIRRQNYNVGDSENHYRDNRTTLTLDWGVSDAVSITNTAYRLASKRLWRNLETYCWVGASGDCPNGIGYGPPGTIYRADNYGIIHDQVQWGDQASVRLSTPMGDTVRNDLAVGFDVNWINLTYSHQFASDYQEDNVALRGFDPGRFLDTVGLKPRYRTRTTEFAVFAEDRLQLTKQFSLVAGLRIETDKTGRWTYVYDASGNTIVGETPALNGGTAAYRSFNDATWRVGAVYQPTPAISLYAQYSTGVDPLGTLATFSTSASQYAFTNAKGEQVEAGAKASFLGGKGTATIAAYRIVKRNLAAQRVTNGPIEQVGQRSSQGVEASLSLDLPAGFGIDANGTVLDARYDEFLSGNTNYTGNTPPNVPETAGNLWLRWDATRAAQARVGLRYVGRSFSDDANRFRVPGYAVVDAALSYAVTRNLALDVRLSNLLDKDYAVTTYSDQQWILGRPRAVDVSLRARF